MNKLRLQWLEMLPAGNGWNVQSYRKGRKEPFRKYYGISQQSVMRLVSILNRNGYHNFFISAGVTGWMEIQLYPDKVLYVPQKEMRWPNASDREAKS